MTYPIPRSLCAAAAALLLCALMPASQARAAHRCFGKAPTIVGTPDKDTLTGTSGPDVIFGDGGADRIDGRGGNDRICGGGGNDDIEGGAGKDRLGSNHGFDEIHGGSGDDLITAGTGDSECFGDILYGGAGDDRMRGSKGGCPDDDRFFPGPGDDVMHGGEGDEVRYTESAHGVNVDLGSGRASGEGNDVIRGVPNVFGSRYADVLIGTRTTNSLDGGPGADTLRGRGGIDFLTDGWSTFFSSDPEAHDKAPDRLVGGGRGDSLSATGGNDVLIGGRGDDGLVDAGRGHDKLVGGEGRDTASFPFASVHANLTTGVAKGGGTARMRSIQDLEGSRYDDRLIGDGFSNRIRAGLGDDILEGRGGDDDLGPDELTPGSYQRPKGGNDVARGGPGRDVIRVEGLRDQGVDIDLAAGTLTGEGRDRVRAIEHVVATYFDDVIKGTGGNDVIEGRDGNDRIVGRAGDDKIDGGKNHDTVDGGKGTDRCVHSETVRDCE
jgi:Ca2+-binding RTX toxin-like protein